MTIETNISRRGFAQMAAAATAAIAGLGIVGCSPETDVEKTGEGEGVPLGSYDEALKAAEESGEWVPVACYHNCGGRCTNKALVMDGVVIRQKTDDVLVDSDATFQNRACPRGRSQQQQMFGETRLKYPMKRKGWQPGGGENANGHLRGVDEWERISWDEAYTYIADELRRIYDNYGPDAVCSGMSSHGDLTQAICRALGGHITVDSEPDSYGHWRFMAQEIGITNISSPDCYTGVSRHELVNAETIVIHGANPTWASAGSPMFHYVKAKEAGVKYIYIGPDYNVSAATLDAHWLPVRPGTDTAFLLGVAWEMIDKGYYDQAFLDKYTVGFDADNMPADAKLDENFKDYVLGAYDGTPKTPEWASEICGTEASEIAWYAEQISKDHDVIFQHSYPAARVNGGEYLNQAFMTVCLMGGHIGKPGNGMGSCWHVFAGNDGNKLVKTASPYSFQAGTFMPNASTKIVPTTVQWRAMLDKKYVDHGAIGYPVNTFTPAEEKDLDIKLYICSGFNHLQSRPDLMGGIEAFKTFETVINFDIRPTMTALYSDLILPVSTSWDSYKLDYLYIAQHNRETALFNRPVVEGFYEAKSDYEIGCELCNRLGLDAAAVFPFDPKLQWFGAWQYTTAQVDGPALMPEATEEELAAQVWKPVVTLTAEDFEKYGVTGEPQEGMISLDQALTDGVWQPGIETGSDRAFIGFEDFIADPEAHPRPTVSGKFEIYCQDRADKVAAMNYATEEFKPYAVWYVAENSYVDSFADWENKVKGPYPLQMYSPHYLRRSHTTMDQVPWLQEAFQNPIFLNEDDAAERGIAEGDTVLIESAYGKAMRIATLSQTIMPGCVSMPHGVQTYIDPETGIDLGGSENTLLGPIKSTFDPAIIGCNSGLVEVSKWEGEPLKPDYMHQFIVDPEQGKMGRL